MRRTEPSSVGRTTVQIWWLLRVSRTVGQEVWMLGRGASSRSRSADGKPTRTGRCELRCGARRDIAVLVAQIVDLAHGRGELLVVLAQLRQHVERRHVI